MCKEGTVKRLNGGLKEYRDEIQGQSSNSIDIGILLRGWREERSFVRANIHNTVQMVFSSLQVVCITRYSGVCCTCPRRNPNNRYTHKQVSSARGNTRLSNLCVGNYFNEQL